MIDLPVTDFEFIIHIGLVCIVPWLFSVVFVGVVGDWSRK